MSLTAQAQEPVPRAPYPLSPGQIAAYRNRGHILLRSLASPREVDVLRPVIDGVIEGVTAKNDTQGRVDDYSSLFRQVTNVWRLDDMVRAFVFSERFARVAAMLMGVHGVRLYHDQALYKPPGGKPTPWHQDQFYWPLDTQHTITMWMPLIDLTREMGTMLFAGGSHSEGSLLNRSISEESHRDLERMVKERGWAVESDDIARGDATFHAGWTVHSAHPNSGHEVRKVLTVIYFADGANVLEPENEFRRADMKAFLAGAGPGRKADGPLNPLLYRA